MVRCKAYILLTFFSLSAVACVGQVVPLLMMDNNHNHLLTRSQMAMNEKPLMRLNVLNKRIETTSDTSTLISLLFQRAYTYQQIGKNSAGLNDFIFADHLIEKTGFQYQVPPLDFSDIYVELQAQLFQEYNNTSSVKVSIEMPSVIVRNDLSALLSANKPGLRYSVRYAYYIQSLLFNLTLIDPGIEKGVLTRQSAIEYASGIIAAYEHLSNPDEAAIYDSLTYDLISQSDLKNSLLALTNYSASKLNSNNAVLKSNASEFFKDMVTIFDNTILPQSNNISIDTAERIAVLRAVNSPSPLINLIKAQSLLDQDSLSLNQRIALSDEKVAYSDFLVGMRIKYSPQSPADENLYQMEESANFQRTVTYILLLIALSLLAIALTIYIDRRRIQRQNNKLLSEIVRGVGDTENYIIERIRKRGD